MAIVLMKMKLNISMESIAAIFGLSSRTTSRLKKFLDPFVLDVPWVFYLASVVVRSATTHLQPNIYHYLEWKNLSSLLG